jgi:hypothetical protein
MHASGSGSALPHPAGPFRVSALTVVNRDEDEGELLAEELAEGALDPDEVPASVDPWGEGSDDET